MDYVVENEKIKDPQMELDPNKFTCGPNKRLKDEEFEDYKIRRKAEKIQMKLLDKYGRRQWHGSKGTYRKVPLTNIEK